MTRQEQAGRVDERCVGEVPRQRSDEFPQCEDVQTLDGAATLSGVERQDVERYEGAKEQARTS